MNKLRIKFHTWLTRLMTHRKFATLATSFWPTRKIAQNQASQLFDIVSGFVYSQILFTAVKLHLLEMVHEKPLPISTISNNIGKDLSHTVRLLKATSALKLTKLLPADHVGLGKLGAAMVTNPGLKEMVLHHEMFYRDMADPLVLLESKSSTQLGKYWSYASTTDLTEHVVSNADEVRAYSELMQASQPMVAEQVLQSYRFDQHKHILDLGGGTGQFLNAVRAQYPDPVFTSFDLPSVTRVAESSIDVESEKAKSSINLVAGDFFQDDLPSGADIITLVRILHDHNDDAVELLLTKAFNALPDQGTILIAEPLAGTPGAERIGDAYFNFYFLSMGKGEARDKSRLTKMLEHAGFSNVRQIRTKIPLICSVLVAQANKSHDKQ